MYDHDEQLTDLSIKFYLSMNNHGEQLIEQRIKLGESYLIASILTMRDCLIYDQKWSASALN